MTTESNHIATNRKLLAAFAIGQAAQMVPTIVHRAKQEDVLNWIARTPASRVWSVYARGAGPLDTVDLMHAAAMDAKRKSAS